MIDVCANEQALVKENFKERNVTKKPLGVELTHVVAESLSPGKRARDPHTRRTINIETLTRRDTSPLASALVPMLGPIVTGVTPDLT